MSLFSRIKRVVPRIIVPRRKVITMSGGWEPDPPSSSYWDAKGMPRAAKIIDPVEDVREVYFIPENTPISSQGMDPTCVSNSCVDGFEILQGLQGQVVQWSRMFLHNNVRLSMDTLHKDGGAYIWKALDVMRHVGLPPEYMYPHDSKLKHKRPPRYLYMHAAKNKLMSYWRVTSQDDAYVRDVIRILRNNNPVVFGTVVGAKYKAYRGEHDNAFGFPSDDGGRHAMLLTGYRITNAGRVHFWCRNSWSRHWGKNGHAWLDQSYMTHRKTRDTWALTRFGK